MPTPLQNLALLARERTQPVTHDDHQNGPYVVKFRHHNREGYLGDARKNYPIVDKVTDATVFSLYENALALADRFGGYVIRKTDEQFVFIF